MEMDLLRFLIDFILNIDVHLGQIISTYGLLTYAILFFIIFMETGLVFTPFLPGDSLLFAAVAFAALNFLTSTEGKLSLLPVSCRLSGPLPRLSPASAK